MDVSSSLLSVIAVLLVSGLAVQLLAHRLKVPSVVFYLVIGVVLGPEVLGLVTLDTFGDGLEIIVGLSVAIIVFEGAFALRIDRIRRASTVSLRLVTVSALVMFLGTAAAVRFFEGATWEIALLIEALLVATGPTVITPILEVVRVRDHIATALETEGIINDVTAAIVAVVVFETLLLDDLGVSATLVSFLQRSGTGVAAGVLATVVIYLLLESEFVPERDARRRSSSCWPRRSGRSQPPKPSRRRRASPRPRRAGYCSVTPTSTTARRSNGSRRTRR
jgi:NhaP-type Na+/H+ or K+/H+ antiporter